MLPRGARGQNDAKGVAQWYQRGKEHNLSQQRHKDSQGMDRTRLGYNGSVSSRYTQRCLIGAESERASENNAANAANAA